MSGTSDLQRDRVAAGLAGAVLLLLCVLFYALHQNVSGLGREIEELKRLNSAVLELDARAAALDGKVAALNSLPRKTEAMVIGNQVKNMAHAARDLEHRLDGRHRDRLTRIQALLQEIGEDLRDLK